LKRIKEYWGIYLLIIFFLAGAAGYFFFIKGEAELLLNRHNNPAFDFLFKYWTYFGGGIAFTALLVALFFYRYYYVILAALIIIFQTILVQGLKIWVFPLSDRPVLFFLGKEKIHLVDGVLMIPNNSFPSGHTATAFSIATILTLIIRNRTLSLTWYFMAIMVGISRVYLMQHFFMDVFGGALTGIAVSLIIYSILERSSLKHSAALNKSLRDII
jgi:membrane-associated phospholipid phosphatase